ncbi:hypothetical protein CYMTET_10168 [Cymbomonas tetramitiformis]|uniref:Uncharacterized protein n=1 Tax=Cymbomonas tetramitiformis TaxID=36881 RepID=A0AAE0LE37_9CHLO|nr:hypothetical protein CYMTET_10168 [Cymbomonas tetramitiformis]
MLRTAIEEFDVRIEEKNEIIRKHEEALREMQDRPRPSGRIRGIGQGTASDTFPNGRHGTLEQPVNEAVAGNKFSGLHSRGLEVNLAQRSEHHTVINLGSPTASEDICSQETEVFPSGAQNQAAASDRSPRARDPTEPHGPVQENVHVTEPHGPVQENVHVTEPHGPVQENVHVAGARAQRGSRRDRHRASSTPGPAHQRSPRSGQRRRRSPSPGERMNPASWSRSQRTHGPGGSPYGKCTAKARRDDGG